MAWLRFFDSKSSTFAELIQTPIMRVVLWRAGDGAGSPLGDDGRRQFLGSHSPGLGDGAVGQLGTGVPDWPRLEI